MRLLHTAWRQLWREWRGGHLTLLLVSIVVAATAIATANMVTHRVEQAVRIGANAALAADIDIQGPTPLPARYRQLAHQHGLDTATIVQFPSVVLADQQAQLARVNAVSQGYPLRGHVRIIEPDTDHATAATAIPPRGTIWVSSRLLTRLRAVVGDSLTLGKATFRIAATLRFMPGQGLNFIHLAPPVMINRADLTETGLVGRGSRVTYHLLAAGAPDATAQFQAAASPSLRATDRLSTLANARSQLRQPLEQAQHFISLAALITVLIAAAAIAIMARQYAVRRTDMFAVLRSFGVNTHTLTQLLALQILILGVIGAVIGYALGYAAQALLINVVLGSVVGHLPTPGAGALLITISVVLILLAGFGWAPLHALRQTPPMRVLRGDRSPKGAHRLFAWVSALLALVLLLVWQLGSAPIIWLSLGGVAATTLVLALGAGVVVFTLRPLRGFGRGWRFGLANLRRRGGLTVFQIAVFGLIIAVLLSLTLVRDNLFSDWRHTVPQHAPNEFIFNIQPGQRHALTALLARHQQPAPTLYSMTRARLVAINNQPVSADDFSHSRAKHLLNRQANLSVAAFRRQSNSLTRGHWWTDADRGKPWISVSRKLAQALDVGTGDTLTFAFSGRQIQFKIVNLRHIRWNSFEPNFYFVVPPGVLTRAPKTYMTSLYLPHDNGALERAIAQQLPGVTTVNVSAIIHTIKTTLTQLTHAMAFVFGFTLIAGLVVLLATIRATADERRHEIALLHTLGATKTTILKALLTEFVTMGAIAGALGGAGAWGINQLLSHFVLHIDATPSPWMIPLGMGCAIVVIGVTALISSRRMLTQSPITALRRP